MVGDICVIIKICQVHLTHCIVPGLTDKYNFTIRAIPERPNGLLLALTNETDLIYAIGTKEGKVTTNPVMLITV